MSSVAVLQAVLSMILVTSSIDSHFFTVNLSLTEQRVYHTLFGSCIYTGVKECTLHYVAPVYIQGIKSVPTLFLPCIYTGDKRVCLTLFDPCSIQGKIKKSVVLSS